jgi:hypothetical protein
MRVDRTNHLVGGNERDARDLGRPVETRRSAVRAPMLAVSAQSWGEGSARWRRKDSRHPVVDRQRSRSRRKRRWQPRSCLGGAALPRSSTADTGDLVTTSAKSDRCSRSANRARRALRLEPLRARDHHERHDSLMLPTWFPARSRTLAVDHRVPAGLAPSPR